MRLASTAFGFAASVTLAGVVSLAAAAIVPARPLPIAAPAAPGAMGSSLTQDANGATYLSWLEPVGAEEWAMKFSRLDPALGRWGRARTIAHGGDWFINWADFPVLAAANGKLTAAWFVTNPGGAQGHHSESYRAMLSVSPDDGATWSAPHPLTRESNSVEFVTFQPLPDGQLLAAWLDGRAHAQGQDRQALYARVVGAPGPDMLVDASVCDCCQLSFGLTADRGALLAYRGRTKDEVRDLQLARFDGRAWSQPVALNADDWKIAGCPVNGPQLAVNGARVGAVWYTSPDGKPKVLARTSADSGKTFGPVTRVDLGRPQGRVDGVMLADGTFAMIWLEASGSESGAAGGLYLRTLTPGGNLSAPQLLAPSTASRASGFPRMVRCGERRLLLTYTQESTPSQILTVQVDLD